ncbi:acylphosphatase [Desulfuromonas sp. AOP6]|uniref:acylphosphatase n=1 Tax=Desulfuromonas sp. AOP6 TaxID=1566351 RepID=UPI00127AA4F5|nr:acylphosphatase [Desulfuromonas sp. AOP6]BCA80538.1 acylphosphatase [Desulfuromonas sp. AOP6]
MNKVRASVRFRGRVQGVNFRAHTQKICRQHHLTGWVRNLPDGDVQALLEGRESDIRSALEACRRGPDAAKVDDVTIDWEEYRDEFASFDICR